MTLSSAFLKEQCDASCLVPASSSNPVNTAFQFSLEISSFFELLLSCFDSLTSLVFSTEATSIGEELSFTIFLVLFSKFLLSVTFSAFF